MHAANEYVRQVMDFIPPALPERARIELDVRAHVEETFEALAGQARAAFERLGEPRDLALGYVADTPRRYASVGKRVAAFLIDMLLGFAVFGTVVGTGALIFGVFAIAEESVRPGMPELSFAVVGVLAVFFVAALALLSIAYFPLLEWRYGQTFGKFVMSIHVTGEDGLRTSLPAAIVRRVPFFFEFFWLDAIVAFFTERRQRAFDLVARTVVLEIR
jgi:uncharacterized RDD family membrane protein YckC